MQLHRRFLRVGSFSAILALSFVFVAFGNFVCFYPVIFSCFFSNLFIREGVLYWILYIY